MSFLQPDPLPAKQKYFAISAIVLMVPVMLDAFGVIELGFFRIVPFLLLPITALLISPHLNQSDVTDG